MKRPIKICSCGRVHFEIPKDAKSSDMGIFWQCPAPCHSTLFRPSLLSSVKVELARIAKKKTGQAAALFLAMVFGFSAYAGTQAECVVAARDFNDNAKGRFVFGLNVKTGVPRLILAKQRKAIATMREQADAATVLRLCLSTDLGRWFGKMNVGDSKALFCEVRNLSTMHGPCDDVESPVEFKAFK